MNDGDAKLRTASWPDDEAEIRAIRHTVFVHGLGVPADLEIDGKDSNCVQVLAYLDGRAVGTGRMAADGHIGRVAVLEAWRGRGIGAGLVRFLVGEARCSGLGRVYLNAQIDAVAFYEKLGFERTGAVFMEAGIEHVMMTWVVTIEERQ